MRNPPSLLISGASIAVAEPAILRGDLATLLDERTCDRAESGSGARLFALAGLSPRRSAVWAGASGLQGRVMAAWLLLADLAAPAGPPLAGTLLDHAGGHSAFVVLALLAGLVTVAVHRSRAMRTTLC